MFTGIAVEHNQWIIVPFDVTQDYHEYGLPGTSTHKGAVAVVVDGLQLVSTSTSAHT